MEEGLRLGLEPGVVCGQVVPPALNLACRSQSGLSPPAVSSENIFGVGSCRLPDTPAPAQRVVGDLASGGGREEGKEAQAVGGGWEERLSGAEAAGLLTVKANRKDCPLSSGLPARNLCAAEPQPRARVRRRAEAGGPGRAARIPTPSSRTPPASPGSLHNFGPRRVHPPPALPPAAAGRRRPPR